MKNAALSRFSVSMPGRLAAQLDAAVKAKGFQSRSQALAHLVRDCVAEHQAESGDRESAGIITLVYDHHKQKLHSLLTHLQHECQELIVAALHVHLDHHNCLEVLVLRGRTGRIRAAADRLIAVKGIKHGRLTLTTTGAEFGA